jgi:predicted nucleic acid-binding protein
MAVVARYLIDTSAAARMADPLIGDQLAPVIDAGLAATCAALDFEALYSARNLAEYEQLREGRRLAYEYLPTDDADWQRAIAVQHELAMRSQLRAVGLPDLLVAAVAERHRVTVLHHNADFDLIAGVTGQRVEWVGR